MAKEIKNNRQRLLDELHDRYVNPKSFQKRLSYYRKRYLWLFVVVSAKLLKRLLDFVISFVLLVLTSPIFLIISLIVKISDGGSVLYVTDRVGKWGKQFRFPKFRTMYVGANMEKEELGHLNRFPYDVKFKIRDDPRVTFFGFILRKSSLDELPQFWCVLKGEMSLVGPRPPLPEEFKKYTIEQKMRLDVTPGLTCFWQVSGRSEIPFKKQVELDLAYIESQSILVDLKILLKTIPAVLSGRGAY